MESPLFSCDLFNAGVELRIWLKQGEEKSLPARILNFQRKRVNVCRDKKVREFNKKIRKFDKNIRKVVKKVQKYEENMKKNVRKKTQK